MLAWGYNADGELGDGNTTNSDVPVKVKLPAGRKVTAIAAGGYLEGVGADTAGPGHSLALTSTGAVLAWGYNADGELGDGNTTNSDVPVKVKLPAGRKVTAIAAGELHSLAVTSTGAVLAWGGNNFGQLGDGSYEGSNVPVRVKLAQAVRARNSPSPPRRSARARCAGSDQRNTQSTDLAGYNFANYIGVPGAVSAIIVVPKLKCKGTRAARALDLRRRRHPVGELVCPSLPGLHAAKRGALLPIARGQWHHQEHRERCGPRWRHDRVRGVPE